MLRTIVVCLLVLVFWGTNAATVGGVCDLDGQKQRRKQSGRVVIRPAEQTKEPVHWAHVKLTIAFFDAIEIESTTYSCDKSRNANHPGYVTYGWLTEVPVNSPAEFLSIPHAVRSLATKNPRRYEVRRNTWIDLETNSVVSVEPTIDFLLEHGRALVPDVWWGRVGLIVSAPYWKVTETGPAAIGFLKLEGAGRGGVGEVRQNYVNFSGRHILCARRNGGIDLISPETTETLAGGPAQAMEKKAAECSSAVQVGPAYFELGDEGDARRNKTGIAGLSLEKARRNILFRTRSTGSEKMFLWTSVGALSPFDAMVLVELLADQVVAENSVVWAVGLQDDEFISGPLLFSDRGRAAALADTDVPTGAVLVIFDMARTRSGK